MQRIREAMSQTEEEDYEVITASQAAELLASVSEDDVQGQ
jgi:hypothetical protein